MFLYLAKRLFKKQHQYDSAPPRIVEANCAHFTGSGSGYSLARSEIFGHVRGAFTDAHDDKKGLVEKADGGLLILEEVGELPKEVQAMLLTFIETGEYRKLGSEKLETANVKVVAATNRESALRDDFRYRFFPYYIPPLRERKNDILYYFHEIFPELTKNFTKSEVLMLLAHDWPGNVREIERIGRLLNRERWISEQIHKNDHDEQKVPPSDRLSHLDPRDTSFDPTLLERFVDDLENWGVDIPFLEKLLHKHRVSVNDTANQKAFEELSSEESGWVSWFDEYTLRFCEEYSPFNEAYEGYLLFSDLFLQDPAKDNNILATIKSQCTISESNYMRYHFDDRPSYQRPLKNLRKKLMKYLMEVDGADYDHIDNPWELWSILEHDKLESNKGYFDFDFDSEELKNAIAEMKEVDLLKLYYQKQLDKTGGNIKAAAKRIGMNVGTFTNRLKKLKMK
jgi:transcriptional regulator with GAF, ATPase, and Fis domain